MENEEVKNTFYYKFSENGIKMRNFQLWNFISNYIKDDIKFKEKFYLYENSIKEIPKCYCGNSVKFIDMKNGYREFCCSKCAHNNIKTKLKRKKTNLEKYGVDNPSKSEQIKNKVKKSNLQKCGFDYPLQSPVVKQKLKEYFTDKFGVDNPSKVREVREKAENTMQEKYGVSHAMQSSEIKDELREYFLEKYGVDNPSKVKEVREKAENTMQEKYGVSHAMQHVYFLNKSINTNLIKYGYKSFTSTNEYKRIMNEYIFDKNSKMVNNKNCVLIKSNSSEYLIKCLVCNSEFIIQRQLWRNRKNNSEEICLFCNPITTNISKKEKDILNYIKEIYDGKIIENYRLNNKEIDIYLPDLKIGFEYNGLYWHSELHKTKNYHYDKLKFFNNHDISLFQIWEDDWSYKSEIVKSMINNKINKSKIIYARKCQIKEIIDNNSIRNFLNENHIQGFVGSKIKIGLFYNDELVSLITFGNLRKSLGQSSKNGSYELLRFCNKRGISVIGGASRLFKYFKSNNIFDEIISYSLNSYSNGDLYKKLGFELKHETCVNYFWCKDGIRYHRFNFRKDKLVKDGYDKNKTEIEIMNDRMFYRLFDCGSKKWIYKN